MSLHTWPPPGRRVDSSPLAGTTVKTVQISTLLLSLKPSLCARPDATARKNFGLSEKEFCELQMALKDGDERLYERIFLFHFKDCLSYLKVKDGADHAEAYDITMDTMVQFRALLVADKIRYGNLRYLFTRMARQSLMRTRGRLGVFSELTASATELPDEEEVFTQEEYELLSRALKSLGRECRELLKAFYFQRRTLKELAEEGNLTAPALRKRKSRCVVALRQYFYHIS